MDYQLDLIIVFALMSGYRKRRYLPPLIWAGLIILGSSIPNLSGLESEITMLDKVMHFAEYFVLGFLAAHAFPGLSRGGPGKAAGLIVLIAAFGVLDELHQTHVPGRTVEVLDMAADVSGGFLSVMIYAMLAKRKKS